VFLSLAVVKRHVPRTAGVHVGAPAGAHWHSNRVWCWTPQPDI